MLAAYLFGLLVMLACSAAYNLTPPSQLKWILRRFDHSAIFLLIAGTYTPLLPFLPDAAQGWTLGLVTWLGAAFGIAMKFIFPGRFDRLAILVYLALGWVGVTAAGAFMQVLPPQVIEPDHRRRTSLHRRRHLPHLGKPEIPQCHLAWLCGRRRRLPLRRNRAALLLTQVFLAHPRLGLVQRRSNHVEHLVDFVRRDDQRRAEGNRIAHGAVDQPKLLQEIRRRLRPPLSSDRRPAWFSCRPPVRARRSGPRRAPRRPADDPPACPAAP